MSRLTVFVPNFFAELLAQSDGKVDAARWPALALLFARAYECPLADSSIEQNLMRLFGHGTCSSDCVSVASLTASIDFDSVPRTGTMRADPVHLRADPNQILLFNDPNIMPSAAEADALIETLNRGLPELGLSRGRDPARWYFCPEDGGASVTTAPGGVNGRSIANFMPRDVGAHALVQLMNEAQMLLHDAAVNAAREAQGIPPINSMWIWDAKLSDNAPGAAPKFVVGNDVLTTALARYFELEWSADMAPGDILSRVTSGDGDGLVVIGSPTGRLEQSNFIPSIDDMEQRWGVPLLNSLRWFRLHEVRLVTDRQSFSLTPWSLFKIWRSRIPTAESSL